MRVEQSGSSDYVVVSRQIQEKDWKRHKEIWGAWYVH